MEPLKAAKTSRMGRRALVLIGIGALSAGSVAGVSFALTSSSSPAAPATTAGTTQNSSTSSGRHARRISIIRRAVHGQVELSTKNGFVTYGFDRGVVTSISSSSITILRADSQSVTEAVNGSTHMPKRGGPTKGEDVVVVSTGGHAIRIFDLAPLSAAKSGTSSSGSGSASASSALSSLG